MLINKDGFKRLFFTIGISFCICILTTYFFMQQTILFSSILKSITLGACIWFVSEISFELVEKIWAHSIIPSYIVLFLIIGIGTACGLFLFGIKSIMLISIICIVAEICGLTIAAISRHRYYKKLNSKLSEFKNES